MFVSTRYHRSDILWIIDCVQKTALTIKLKWTHDPKAELIIVKAILFHIVPLDYDVMAFNCVFRLNFYDNIYVRTS